MLFTRFPFNSDYFKTVKFLINFKASPYYLKAKHKKTCHRSCRESYYAAEEMTGLLCLLLYSLILIPTKNLKPAFRAKSPFSQAVCYLVSVQPCAGLNEKVYCTLACISTFSSKSAYGEPTMLLVFMNMETRRCHG